MLETLLVLVVLLILLAVANLVMLRRGGSTPELTATADTTEFERRMRAGLASCAGVGRAKDLAVLGGGGGGGLCAAACGKALHLGLLAEEVSGPLDRLLRRTLVALITADVHARVRTSYRMSAL